MLTPKDMLERLIDKHNMTEVEIVAALEKLGCKTTQPTINRLKNGEHETCSWHLGNAIEQLHSRRRAAV